MTTVMFISGIAALTAGAEMLVRGASRIASALGISPLIVGLTVVAFGTSSPELAVGVGAAWVSQADIVVGNVVGSNIFNALFIIGVSALIVPLAVAQQLVRIDVPLLIVCSVVLALMAMDGEIGRIDGTLLCLGVIAYTFFLVLQARKERDPQIISEYAEAYPGSRAKHWMVNITLILLGLPLLVLGANWLVDAAVVFARQLGVSELVIGLTVVAAGTSLPEVAASVVAALKGERDIAVGNAIGSSIYNILLVLGVTALIAPAGIEVAQSVSNFDLPVMIAVSVACLPIFFTGYRIDRWEGAVFLGYYFSYAAYVVMKATEHDLLEPFSETMVFFVMPLSVLTAALLLARARRAAPE
ncbi:MAG: calcium/sodium antiporter [Betaproteobacteria bacterium]|jgi:cation:H+ antiporter|nr:MAG: calcium/sodium antiporter [Betaproteobacteria bacterium]